MTTAEYVPRGVHLVGSVLLNTAEEVFRQAIGRLPGRLRRLPDGETGVRYHFIRLQCAQLIDLLADHPGLTRDFTRLTKDPDPNEAQETSLPEGAVEKLERLDTGYDTYAIESYRVFQRLRSEGVIPAGVRFLVGIPMPIIIVGVAFEPRFQAIAEPYYEKAILQAMRRMQDEIPAQDLAIQLECPYEVALLEGVEDPVYRAWWSPLEEGIYDRIERVAAAIDKEVELGFHLCYGDNGHVHFKEPKDTQLLVDMTNTIVARCAHKLSFIHMPVPKDRDDDAYFAPLKGLALDPSTELYLGLVHGWDEEGTKRRIAAASKVVRDFGVATECGGGRFAEGELDSTFEISTAVTRPWA